MGLLAVSLVPLENPQWMGCTKVISHCVDLQCRSYWTYFHHWRFQKLKIKQKLGELGNTPLGVSTIGALMQGGGFVVFRSMQVLNFEYSCHCKFNKLIHKHMYFVKLDYNMCSTTKATFEMICNKKYDCLGDGVWRQHLNRWQFRDILEGIWEIVMGGILREFLNGRTSGAWMQPQGQ